MAKALLIYLLYTGYEVNLAFLSVHEVMLISVSVFGVYKYLLNSFQPRSCSCTGHLLAAHDVLAKSPWYCFCPPDWMMLFKQKIRVCA